MAGCKPKVKADDEKYACLRHCFASNVFMLGFNESSIAKQNEVSVERDSFALPNKPLFHCLMFFLFCELDKLKAEKDFRDCWPVLDRKQESKFRSVSIGLLQSLPEDEIRLPQNVGYLLLSPYGIKFHQFGICFTTYVLTNRLKRKKGLNFFMLSVPKDLGTKEEQDGVFKMFEAATMMHFECYLETEKAKLAACGTFKKEYSKQVEVHGALLAEIEQLKKSICSNEEKLSQNLSDSNQQFDDLVSDVTESWQTVDDLCKRMKEPIESLNYFVSGDFEKYKLDGSNLSTNALPLLIDEQNAKNLDESRLQRLDENGNINLEHFVNSFNQALRLYSLKLQKVVECRTNKDFELVSEHLNRCKECEAPIRSLQSKLVPFAAEVKSSSETLFRNAVSELDSERTNPKDYLCLPPPLTPPFDPKVYK